MHSLKGLCLTTSVIFLICQKVITKCDVCGGVIYISNKSKYLKNEVRYPTAVKNNLFNNFKSSLELESFLQP